MKKLKNLFSILLMIMVLIPFGVSAEEDVETTSVEKEPVNVYVFRGETCTFCKALLSWFETIEDEYGEYYNLVTYEVWNDEDNASLMQEVAGIMGDTVNGVPYIVVGNYSYPNGFSSDTVVDSDTNQTMGEQLIERILEVYESDNRYDVMDNVEVKEEKDYSTVVGIGAVIIIAGLATVAIISRRQSM